MPRSNFPKQRSRDGQVVLPSNANNLHSQKDPANSNAPFLDCNKSWGEMTDYELEESIKPYGKKSLTYEQCELMRAVGNWRKLSLFKKIEIANRLYQMYPQTVCEAIHLQDIKDLECPYQERPRVMDIFIADITGSRQLLKSIGNHVVHLIEAKAIDLPGIGSAELDQMLENTHQAWVDNYRAKHS